MITAEQAQKLLDAATPGPWRVGAEGSEGSRVNPDSSDKRESLHYIAAVNGRVQPQDGYNARLIAAAPQLAETVVELHTKIAAVSALADKWEHGALRWADPLPVPPEVGLIREALGDQR